MKTKEMAMPMPADATNNKIGSRKRASFVQSKMYIDREEAHVAIFHFIQPLAAPQRRSIAVAPSVGREVRPAFFVSGRPARGLRGAPAAREISTTTDDTPALAFGPKSEPNPSSAPRWETPTRPSSIRHQDHRHAASLSSRNLCFQGAIEA